MQLPPQEEPVARELLKEIQSRLGFLLDVGLGYLTLERSATTLSGGESQRIRLASQMGSELTGVIYILDEPSIGLHQRDNGKLLATLKRLRDLGNSVIVVEHDEETMREADSHRRLRPGRRRAGGPGRRPGHAGAKSWRARQASPAPTSVAAPAIDVPARRRPPGPARLVVEGRGPNNLQDVTVEFPLGPAGGRHRRVRRGQVHPGQRDPLPRPRPAAERRARGGRPAPGRSRGRAPRQGDRHRPAAHRSHPAQQPGHLHQGVRRHPRCLRPHPGGPHLRVRPRALQLQHEGRPLRGVRGRRGEAGGDALPGRRLRPLRGVRRQALQRGHAARALQGQEHRRGAAR